MHIDLKRARERRGLSQAQLAAASGVDKGTISRLECRRTTNPLSGTVEKLEQALKLLRGERLAFGAKAAA
jgi:transcriptional regulator with XRE-family HTH domain